MIYIPCCLTLTKNPFTILIHDSFNPQCRAGIQSVDYREYPHVTYVEVDYITGSFWHNDTYREMWGGLALIQVNPNTTSSEPIINESQKHLFTHTRYGSVHLIKDKLRFLMPLKKRIYKILGKKDGFEMYLNLKNELPVTQWITLCCKDVLLHIHPKAKTM